MIIEKINMNIKLLDFKELADFPSGSGIECYDDQVYLVGDDARNILVMNKRWKTRETINLFPGDSPRIEKMIKADFEATTIVQINKVPFLLLLGSGSIEATRNKAILLNLKSKEVEEIDLSVFYDRLRQSGFPELNIEGACVMDDKMILCNRGNKSRPDQSIIVTSLDFWKKQNAADIMRVKIEWEQAPQEITGYSGLTYSYKNDWLIFTASSEHTFNSINDGPIGDSYIGVIENASRKIGRKRIKLNEVFNLSDIDAKLKGYKMESVCMQADREKRLKLHLVADNDTGESFLFKMRLKE